MSLSWLVTYRMARKVRFGSEAATLLHVRYRPKADTPHRALYTPAAAENIKMKDARKSARIRYKSDL